MAGTTETQLRDLVSAMHLKHRFLGVYDNTFPGFMNPNQRASAIVNTGSRASGGMHWIGFAYEPSGRLCYMFDPFGWSDAELWRIYKFKYEAFLRRTGLQQPDRCITLVKSTEAVQCPCSAACGLFAALFIASFDAYPRSPMSNNHIIDVVDGVPHNKLNDPEYQRILHRNQEHLYQWFAKTNAYFRDHEALLKRETSLYSLSDFHAR